MAARILLLSPALSADQVVEAAILKLYVEKAGRTVFGPETAVVASWEQPAVALATSALSGRLLGGDALPQQTVLLSVAAAASLAYALERCDLVVVCFNGPVPNPGFCAFAALAAASNRPVVVWKDDVRKLWGLEDDPLTLGLLPGASGHLLAFGPPHSQTYLARLTAADRSNAFVELMRTALEQTVGDPTPLPGTYTRKLVAIGAAVQKAGAAYADVRQAVLRHANLLAAQDREFLGVTE